MDSLVTSAVALAAGGWNKVKLVGIYTQTASNIPLWKLGIYSPNEPATTSGSPANSITWPSGVLIAPNSTVGFIVDGNGFNAHFESNAITNPNSFVIHGIAILFTWD